MIDTVIAFFKSKAGAILAGLIAGVGAIAALFALGKKQGALEQKVAQEEHKDRAEAELLAAELAEESAADLRAGKLVEDLVVIEEVAAGAKANPPATITAARAEQSSSRHQLEQLRRAGLVKKP